VLPVTSVTLLFFGFIPNGIWPSLPDKFWRRADGFGARKLGGSTCDQLLPVDASTGQSLVSKRGAAVILQGAHSGGRSWPHAVSSRAVLSCAPAPDAGKSESRGTGERILPRVRESYLNSQDLGVAVARRGLEIIP
jgi:hypothetical protein